MEKVDVSACTFKGPGIGVRIKTWQASNHLISNLKVCEQLILLSIFFPREDGGVSGTFHTRTLKSKKLALPLSSTNFTVPAEVARTM